LLAQQPQFVINTLLSGAAADLQKELTAGGRMIPTSSLSFVGAEQYIQAAGPSSAGVSITQVVPSPHNMAIPAVRECAAALQAHGIKTAMNSTQLEACFAAKVLTEGLRRAKKPTPASLRDSLANLGAYDLGGYKVSFAPGAQHGSKYVELDMVTRDGKLSSR
jgi:branched-chain amino acid transport system substrate-binding protein